MATPASAAVASASKEKIVYNFAAIESFGNFLLLKQARQPTAMLEFSH
jgi:hypothetical protein